MPRVASPKHGPGRQEVLAASVLGDVRFHILVAAGLGLDFSANNAPASEDSLLRFTWWLS